METESTTDRDGTRVIHKHRLHDFERALAIVTTACAVILTIIEIGRVVAHWT